MARQLPSESDIPYHGWYPYTDIHRERIAAHEKHVLKGGSMEKKSWNDPAWLPVLVEEVGECARVLNEHMLGNLNVDDSAVSLRTELVQVAAMATAWLEAIDARRHS